MAIHRLRWDEDFPACCRAGAVAVGNFDGVHRGHGALLAELRKQSREIRGPAVAVTFDPHPLELLRPELFMPVLTTIADRAELLQACGADQVVILKTNAALLQLGAREFFARVLNERLVARVIVEGPNFGFGRNREGDLALLETLCRHADIRLIVLPALADGGLPISSSRVRQALVRGAVHEAALLLGRPFRLRGAVVEGKKRGQRLGFPTANLAQVPTIVPGDGVYAAFVHHAGRTWPGAVHIGRNATFGEQERTVEVHVIGFQGDLYGQDLAVDFLERLRDTRSFRDADELIEQLQQDVARAREIAGP
jgi:riboflavin kinase / FMN adenylyltransferase